MCDGSNSRSGHVLTLRVEYDPLRAFQQNRPFNVQNIVDAFQAQGIKKTQTQRILDDLVADGTLIMKAYGKVKIYCANQAHFEKLSEDEMASMADRIAELGEKVKAIDGELSGLTSTNRALLATPSNANLASSLGAATDELGKKQASLAKLQSGNVRLISRDELQALQNKLAGAVKIWRKRKRAAMDMIGELAEGMDKKPAALMEEIGLEADEDVGVAIDDFVVQPPTKRPRLA